MSRGHRLMCLFRVEPLRDLSRPPKGQVASLDFLRACAILLVVTFHFSCDGYLKLGGCENALSRLPVVRYGRIGVDLFFVLSGFLIGKQLWRELEGTGSIGLGRFLVRRGLRIWPLYFSVFLFVLVTRICGQGANIPGWGWANILFLSNYFPRLDIVPGSWSLAVEEQFYVATPLLLLAGVVCAVPLRCYRWLLVALLVTLPLMRAIALHMVSGDAATPLGAGMREACLLKPIHTHADGLVMGLFLAHLQVLDGEGYRRGFSGSPLPVLICAGAFVAFFRNALLSFTGCALLFGSCTWFLAGRRRAWLRPLESWVFYVLSRLSFGMYLNHFYLLHPTARLTHRYLPGGGWAPALQQVAGSLLLILASAAVAMVTFCLIEWPFLRLREWMVPAPSCPSFNSMSLLSPGAGAATHPGSCSARRHRMRGCAAPSHPAS